MGVADFMDIYMRWDFKSGDGLRCAGTPDNNL